MPTWNSKGSIFMPVLCSLLCLHCSLASILVIRSMSWDKQETIWWKLFLAARRLDDPLRRHSDEHALQYNSRLNSPLWHKYILHFDTNTVFQFETNTVCNLRQIQFPIWDKFYLKFETNTWQLTLQYNCAHAALNFNTFKNRAWRH